MGILMHGDAAFAGQGLVYETLAMSQLIGYRTGGTVHLIVNNQIGFTTVPAHAYSGLYCTDIAKSVQCPILHVNGDEPEAVVFCAKLAAEFRMEFGTDFVLDIVCYRRHGHNETDEPAFTQPIMYRAIKARPTTRTLYAERLAAEGSVVGRGLAGDLGRVPGDAGGRLPGGAGLQAEQGGLARGALGGTEAGGRGRRAVRGVDGADDGRSCSGGPGAERDAARDFDLNPKIARQLEAKRAMIESGRGDRLGDRRGAGVRRACCWRAAGCGCRARTASAARSASGTPC